MSATASGSGTASLWSRRVIADRQTALGVFPTTASGASSTIAAETTEPLGQPTTLQVREFVGDNGMAAVAINLRDPIFPETPCNETGSDDE